jgi:hypothetical protein
MIDHLRLIGSRSIGSRPVRPPRPSRATPITRIASNAGLAVKWVEGEFATTNLIHGRDEELAGYSIIVRTAEDQLLMVTLLDEFLSDYAVTEVGLLLDVWRVGNAMSWAGPSQPVVVTKQGLRVEAR